jgi:hypothetical protein
MQKIKYAQFSMNRSGILDIEKGGSKENYMKNPWRQSHIKRTWKIRGDLETKQVGGPDLEKNVYSMEHDLKEGMNS